mgnify:CR=1 FL=1
MVKKLLSILIVVMFLFLESCGTILKYKYIDKPVSNKLDWGIVALDGIGLILFIIPGIVAFSIDYATGTLFIPEGPISLKNTTSKDIQKILAKNNIYIPLEQLQEAKKLALQSK